MRAPVQPIPCTIQIGDQHEYFFAICAGSRHSYVMVGVKDLQTNMMFPLFSAGKYFVVENRSRWQLYLSMFTSATAARLRMEADYFHDTTTGEFSHQPFMTFTYKAYAFSEEKYRRFLTSIANCHARTSHFCAYQKQAVQPGQLPNSVIFKYLPITETNEALPMFAANAAFNSVSNSCRHTAIAMLMHATDMAVKDEAISTNLLTALPYTAWLDNGRLNPGFLIFPMPPVQHDLNPDIYSLLTIIYQHLTIIPKSFDTNEVTYHKFHAIKQLYLQLEANPSQSLHALHQYIAAWEVTHRALIDTHRGYHLLSNTATRKMVNEVDAFLLACSPRFL